MRKSFAMTVVTILKDRQEYFIYSKKSRIEALSNSQKKAYKRRGSNAEPRTSSASTYNKFKRDGQTNIEILENKIYDFSDGFFCQDDKS